MTPASGRGPESAPASSIRTPASAQRRTTSACQSTANHSRTASAIVGPTPSAAANSSTDADRIASIEPNSRASACAAVGPTCRMDSPTSTRHSGRSFAAARLSSSRSGIRRRRAVLLAEQLGPAEPVDVEVEQVALVPQHRVYAVVGAVLGRVVSAIAAS